MISSFVITGFLGVGKTTLLTNSVQHYLPDKKIAVIVNEFGDIGIDSKILTNVYSEVLEISEGCICCQLSEEFEKGVMEIIANYSPELIFVETSGASEPFPIYMSLQNLGVGVEGVICVVDAKHFSSYKENSTAKYQLGGSNIIVLNKTDLVNDSEALAVENEIREIKDKYNIKNMMTGKPIFNNYLIHRAQHGLVAKEVFDGVYRLEDVLKLAEDYTHHDHTSKDALSQKVVYLKSNILFADVDSVLKDLPQSIYRAKGIVKVKDVPEAIVVNYAFGDVTFDELKDYEGKSLLIFIGENIEHEVENLCEKFDILSLPRFSLKG